MSHPVRRTRRPATTMAANALTPGGAGVRGRLSAEQGCSGCWAYLLEVQQACTPLVSRGAEVCQTTVRALGAPGLCIPRQGASTGAQGADGSGFGWPPTSKHLVTYATSYWFSNPLSKLFLCISSGKSLHISVWHGMEARCAMGVWIGLGLAHGWRRTWGC